MRDFDLMYIQPVAFFSTLSLQERLVCTGNQAIFICDSDANPVLNGCRFPKVCHIYFSLALVFQQAWQLRSASRFLTCLSWSLLSTVQWVWQQCLLAWLSTLQNTHILQWMQHQISPRLWPTLVLTSVESPLVGLLLPMGNYRVSDLI